MHEKEWNPGEILELSGYYWKTCALHAGVKLGIFTAIGEEKLTAGEIAQKTQTDERAVTMLLNALASMQLLAKKGDQYANTSTGKSFLSRNSPRYIGHIIMHHHHLMESWSKLNQAVQTGRPVRSRSAFSDDERRESFLMGMFNMAMNLAPQLVPQIDLSARTHLLDLGGGPGTYAIHFCKHNPQLRATVYDLPTTRPFAQKTIAAFGLSDRIDFMEGNFLEKNIEGTYDVAWLSQILHAEGPEDCRTIVKKAASVLQPGGMILIHEFILNDTMDGPVFPTLFSLNMLLGTTNGQSYSEREIMDMLAQAGIREIRRLPFQGPSDSGIICGLK